MLWLGDLTACQNRYGLDERAAAIKNLPRMSSASFETSPKPSGLSSVGSMHVTHRLAVSAGCRILGLLILGPATGAPVAAPESCRSSPLREDRLESVGPRGEVVMMSGVHAVLADIHWPETASEAAQAADFLIGFRGRMLTVSARGKEDRWGRARIEAVAEPASDADEPADLASGLVAAGLAHIDVGESDLLCRSDLIALEAEPRAARRGIWRDGTLDAGDGGVLGALGGRFVVVEGRVASVGERTERVYLDFVRNSADGLTVVVSKRTWRFMQERGLTAATMRGRLVRVRGRIEIRRGPTLDIVSPDMVELLEEERAPRR